MKYTFLLCLFLGLYTHLYCQDPLFSNFLASQSTLNPALTAYRQGISASFQRRDMWRYVRQGYSKFVTNAVTAEMNVPCLRSGFGVGYFSDVEGEGYVRWNRACASYAFRKLENGIDQMDYSDFMLGATISYNWRGYDPKYLVFSEQLDPIYGVQGTSTFANFTPAKPTIESNIDLDIGAAYFRRKWSAGIVLHNLNRQGVSLIGASGRLPMRLTLHAAYKYARLSKAAMRGNEDMAFSPFFKFDYQGSSTLPNAIPYFSTGTGFTLLIANMYGGAAVRSRYLVPDGTNTAFVTFMFGYEKYGNDYFRAGASYDMNVSGIGPTARGGVEVFLTIGLNKDLFCRQTTVSTALKRRLCPYPGL